MHLSGVVWFAGRGELFSFELEGVGNGVGQHHSSDGGKVSVVLQLFLQLFL